MSWLPVLLISSSATSSLDGRAVQLIVVCLTMQGGLTFLLHLEHTIWLMLDSHLVMPYWCHIEESDIISRNGQEVA